MILEKMQFVKALIFLRSKFVMLGQNKNFDVRRRFHPASTMSRQLTLVFMSHFNIVTAFLSKPM